MSDLSKPPGLDDDLPPGLEAQPEPNQKAHQQSRARTDASVPQSHGVGRGSGPSHPQQHQHSHNQTQPGQGKKKPAKASAATQAAPAKASKSANLSSFDAPVESTFIEPKAEPKKAATVIPAKPQAKKSVLELDASSKTWIPKHLPPVDQQVMCLICCEPIEFFAIGECNHTEICGMCTIRRRQIYEEMDCCICKKTLDAIVIDKMVAANKSSLSSSDAAPTLKFAELYAKKTSKNVLPDSTITVNDPVYFAYCMSLFERHCPGCSDGKTFPSTQALKKHVENFHRRNFCDLCLENRKCFLHEQKLYTPEELVHHMQKGDPSIQLKPHPECEYCHTVFFSLEDLFRHCEEAHFKCFLCERENILYNYFRNYDHLDQHFVRKHYACREKECLDKKFVVFPSALDLQAHNVATHVAHGNKRSNTSRVINLETLGDNQRTVRSLARPAQMPVFYPDRQRPVQEEKESFSLAGRIEDRKPSSSSAPVVLRGDVAPPAVVPVVQAPYVSPYAHLSVSERSKTLIASIKAVLGSEAKYTRFRTFNADFRASKITASNYYQQFLQLFGDDAQALSIYDELVDLMPEAGKQAELKTLRAEWRRVSQASHVAQPQPQARIQQDESAFPSLNGSNSGPANTTAAFTTHYGKALLGKSENGGAAEEAFPSLPSAPPRASNQSLPNSWNGTANPNTNMRVVSHKGGKGKGKGKQWLVLH